MRPDKRKAAETVRPRIFAFVATLGAVAAVLGAYAAPQALATPSKVKLEVNQNCVDPDWPCWTTEPSASNPQPALKVTITEGGKVEFVDHDPSRTASVVWTSDPTTPSCLGVPTTTTASTDWEGTCTFAMPGTYHFESSTLFKEAGLYGTNDYTKYEVLVTGPPTPTATTEQATAATETEATLNGSIDPEGFTVEYHFEYEGPGVAGKQSTSTATLTAADFTSHPVSAQVNSLEPDMTYHFQLVTVYGAGKTKVEGGNMTFKTAAPPSAPTASTQPATAVTETEAMLNGTVNPDGEMTEYFFEYGTGTGYGQTTGKISLSAGSSNQVVSATVKGLTAGTEYHFRLVAENKLGSEKGLDESFKSTSTPSKEPTKESSPTPTTPIDSPITTSMQPPAPVQSAPPAIPTTTQTKPLTRAQKLAKALKQCKKQPKKKRAECEVKAKKLYGPKHKSHNK